MEQSIFSYFVILQLKHYWSIVRQGKNTEFDILL